MAYIPTYQMSYTNEEMNEVVVTFSEKDGTAEEVTEYDTVAIRISYNGEEGKFNDIYGMSGEFEYWVKPDQDDPTDVFVQAKKDTWLVTVTVDTKPFFSGYILPSEGGVPFQDKPYSAKVTAVDGIGLLKDISIEESTFTNHHSIISYVAYCLNQTGLTLPIRVQDYMYHESFEDRTDNIAADFFSQAFLEYRTFQKDAISFTNCYNVLEIILKENYRLSQDNGEWKITRLGMLQNVPFGIPYETLYDANGENPVGVEVTENYGTVGKGQLIYPHSEDQIKYIKKAVKSSRLNFNYEIWPELPKNNKFERGPLMSQGVATDDSDIDGDNDFTEVIGTVKRYAINNWFWGQFSLNDAPDFDMNTGPVDQPLINKVYNEFDLEIIREISIPASKAGADFIVTGLKSGTIPVIQGDRIKFSVDKRYDADLRERNSSNFSSAAIVYIIPTGGGDARYLINSFTDPTKDGNWADQFVLFSLTSTVDIRFGDTDTRRYASVTVESQPIPVNGDLTIILLNPSRPDHDPFNPGVTYHTAFYRNFDLEYLPMVAGGFQKVKGDYDIITQNIDYQDKSETEVFLSDNPHKVFKGCLLDSAGVPLSKQFKRFGVTESKSYKAVANYAHFNMEHRRMAMIEGSFSSLMYNPQNNQEFYYPVSLHKQYQFTDIPGDKRFILSAPLEMDLVKCFLSARFYEIYDSYHLNLDGISNGTEEFKYIF